MASSSQHVLLSPAELAYLHSSLSLTPPIRPDGRTSTQFRPLVAETGILPGANGSARICFADGTEAIVGVKAEVERTESRSDDETVFLEGGVGGGDDEDMEDASAKGDRRTGDSSWVEMTVEIPGLRDDDSGTAFLAAMLSEALLADGEFVKRLWINRRFHWKLYLDVCPVCPRNNLPTVLTKPNQITKNPLFSILQILLISPPLSYPLPLLSLTTHLALLSTRLPRLKSEGDEDPFFDDDWAAAPYLFPRHPPRSPTKSTTSTAGNNSKTHRPPITLLVMAVGNNILFDPCKEELAVADVALAVSVTATDDDPSESQPAAASQQPPPPPQQQQEETTPIGKQGRNLRLLSIRTIDPPSRLTPPGVPNAANAAYGNNAANGMAAAQQREAARTAETAAVEGVWKAPRGGAKRSVLAALVHKVLERGGVVDEVLDALEGVELG